MAIAVKKNPAAKLLKTTKTVESAAVADSGTASPVPTEAEGATVTKTKAVPAEKASVAVSDKTDLIVSTAHDIENMKQDKALALVPRLLDNIENDYFKLGGVLSLIQSQGWFQDKGYETFRAFVESELGMQYRKSMYLIGIYNNLVQAGVPWDKVKSLGWTKLNELAPILALDNVDDWVSLAEESTVLQLREAIKEAQAGTSADGGKPNPDAAADKTTTTMTFKVHTDQKATIREALDKAKHQSGTDVDTVALENMCIDFLGGKVKTGASLLELMKAKDISEVLEALNEAFPLVSIAAVQYDTIEELQAAEAAEAAAVEAAESDEAAE